jgi:hypothetical protein
LLKALIHLFELIVCLILLCLQVCLMLKLLVKLDRELLSF